MLNGTRREVMRAASLLVSASGVGQALASSPASVASDLARYIEFGGKAAGSPGDEACGAWLEGELRAVGFTVERQHYDAPYFAAERAELAIGELSAPVIPQPIVVQTGEDGVTGRLVRVAPQESASQALHRTIALIDLPYGRWSSATAKPILETVRAALTNGASGAVIVTNGPTGKALALNCDGHVPMFDKPVAILAPEHASGFFAGACGTASATLRITGKGGRRPVFNLIGRRERAGQPWIVISTPRSGWYICAGERGPGVATWLGLARTAPSAFPDFSLALICNSGHEYEHLGAEIALKAAPPPSQTAFWLHLGANVAARDWHEAGNGRLLPLETADVQRFLVTSPAHLEIAKAAFSGQPGLGSPYPLAEGAAGELSNIVRAGYGSVAGIFGAHRYHHTAEDDARTVVPALVEQALRGCRNLLDRVAAQSRRSR